MFIILESLNHFRTYLTVRLAPGKGRHPGFLTEDSYPKINRKKLMKVLQESGTFFPVAPNQKSPFFTG
jgi:hypothetical protein